MEEPILLQLQNLFEIIVELTYIVCKKQIFLRKELEVVKNSTRTSIKAICLSILREKK